MVSGGGAAMSARTSANTVGFHEYGAAEVVVELPDDAAGTATKAAAFSATGCVVEATGVEEIFSSGNDAAAAAAPEG
jgi:hypothetical protein